MTRAVCKHDGVLMCEFVLLASHLVGSKFGLKPTEQNRNLPMSEERKLDLLYVYEVGISASKLGNLRKQNRF